MYEFFPGSPESEEYQQAAQLLVDKVGLLVGQLEHEGTYYGFREVGAVDNPDLPVGLLILKSHTGPITDPQSRIVSLEFYQPLAPNFVLMQEYWVRLTSSAAYQVEFQYFLLDSDLGPSAIDGPEFSELTHDHINGLSSQLEESEPTNQTFMIF